MPAPRKDMPELMDRLADLVADGKDIRAAGAAMGLTPGQATNIWGHIKRGLGPQAA